MSQQTKLRIATIAACLTVTFALGASGTALAEPPATGEYDLALPQSGEPQDPAGTGAGATSSSGTVEETTSEPAGTVVEEEPQTTGGGGGGGNEPKPKPAGGSDTKPTAAPNEPAPKPLGGATKIDDDSGSSSLPWLLGLLAAVAVAGIAATVWRRRRAAASSSGEPLGTRGVGESRVH